MQLIDWLYWPNLIATNFVKFCMVVMHNLQLVCTIMPWLFSHASQALLEKGCYLIDNLKSFNCELRIWINFYSKAMRSNLTMKKSYLLENLKSFHYELRIWISFYSKAIDNNFHWWKVIFLKSFICKLWMWANFY